MAEIFLRPNQYLETGRRAVASESQTGDADLNSYLSGLPEAEREEALKRITAPINGKDIADKMMEDEKFMPSLDEFRLYSSWKKDQEVDILDALGKGSEHILDTFGAAIGSATDHPLSAFLKSGTSLVEAFSQGSRNLYGMVAQSQNPSSPFFKLKAALQGSGSEEEQYRVFKEARRFNEQSMRYMRGEDTMVVNKDYIDHEMTQAMSYIADPTLFIPFGNVALGGAKLLGMGERVAMIGSRVASIKHKILGGALKYGAGMPIEFLGNATRNTIDYGLGLGVRGLETATGIPAAELRATARASMVGTTAASLAGYGVPYVSGIGEAYVAGTAGRGLGEALQATGEQIMKGERGINSYARAALEANKDILSPHAKGLLNVLNAVDPLFVYTADAVGGATHGAMIGGTLGYLSGGKEGMAQGLGAGIVLGAGGAVLGRTTSFLSGRTYSERTAIQAKMALEGLKDLDINEHQMRSLFQAIGNKSGNGDLTNGILAAVDDYAPNAKFKMHDPMDYAKFLLDNGFDPITGKHKTDPTKPAQTTTFEYWNSDGMVVEKGADGSLNIHINTAKLGQFGNTVPHEIYHAIFRDSKMAPEFIKRLKDNLIGVRDQSGKLLQEGSVNFAQTRQMFRKYIGLTARNDQDKQDKLLQLDKAFDEHKKTGQINSLDHINLIDKLTEEFGAYYFTEWIKGKSPDYLFLGGEYSGLRSVLEMTKGGWVDFWSATLGKANPTDFNFSRIVTDANGRQRISYLTEDFAGGGEKRVRNKALDLAMEDMVKAVRNSNRTGTLDLRSLSPEGRKEFIERNGLDGHRELTGASRAERRKLAAQRKQMGQDIHKALNALDPAQRTSFVDPTTGNITGRLSQPEIDHLVVGGLISRAMGDKIKILQDIADRAGPRAILEYGYLGDSHHTSETSDARVYGDQVPFTNRRVLLMDFGINIGSKGELSLLAKTLDWAVIEERGSRMWKQDSVRALWNNDRQAFDRDFIDYLSNASKDKGDATRQQSADLLNHGDGNGAARRNILHQVSGFVKDDSVGYINKPLGEIHKGLIASLTNFSALNMTSIRVTGEAYDFNFANAFQDISRNFKPSEMKAEPTPEGVIYKHASGYKFIKGNLGASAYDDKGFSIGSFKSIEEAAEAGRKLYLAREKATDATGKEITDKHGNGVTFKPREEFISDEIANNRTKIIQLLRDVYESQHNIARPESERIGNDLTAVRSTEEHIETSAEKARGLKKINDDINAFDSDELGGNGVHSVDLIKRAFGDWVANETQIKQSNRVGQPSLSDEAINILREKSNDAIERVSHFTDKNTGKSFGEMFNAWKEYWDIITAHPSKWRFMEKSVKVKDFITKLQSGKVSSWELKQFVKDSESGVASSNIVDSRVNDIKTLIGSFGVKWDTMYPMTFRSALVDKVESMLKTTPNMTYQQLLKKILVNNDGHKLWSEADAIGLLDFVKSKIQPTYTVRRAMDGTNRLIQMRKGETQGLVDVNELREFINTNKIDLTIDEGAKEIHNMRTENFTSGGTKEGYTETAVRISPKYAHGIKGHYGGDVIVHTRTTIRYDSEGNKYLFVEEVQANNTAKQNALDETRIQKRAEEAKTKLPILEQVFADAIKEGVYVKMPDGSYASGIRDFNGRLDALFHTRWDGTQQSTVDGTLTTKLPLNGKWGNLDRLVVRNALQDNSVAILMTLFDKYRTLQKEAFGLEKTINAHTSVLANGDFYGEYPNGTGFVMSKGRMELTKRELAEVQQKIKDYRKTALDEEISEQLRIVYEGDMTPENIGVFIEGFKKTPELMQLVNEALNNADNLNNLEYKLHKNKIDNTMSYGMNPHFLEAEITDMKTSLQRVQAKKQAHPLTEITEWSKVALITTIREAIRKGIDNVSLTHPDDTPLECNMKLDARHADYGVIFPQVWGSFLSKYGIEISRQGKLSDPALGMAKEEYLRVSEDVTKATEKVLQIFESVGQTEDPLVINPLSELLSKTMENFTDDDSQKITKLTLKIQNKELQTAISEVNGSKTAQKLFYEKYAEAQKKQFQATTPAKKKFKDKDALSAALIDRGYSFKLNQKIKDAFMNGDEGSPMTAYKPSEGEDGVVYPMPKDYAKSVNIKSSVSQKPSEDYKTFSNRVLDDLSSGNLSKFKHKETAKIWKNFLDDYVASKGGDYAEIQHYFDAKKKFEQIEQELSDASDWYNRHGNDPDMLDAEDRPRDLDDIRQERQDAKNEENDLYRGLSSENDQVLSFVEEANQFFDKIWKGNYTSWKEVQRYAGFDDVRRAVETSIGRLYNKQFPPVFKSELFNTTRDGDKKTFGGAIMDVLKRLNLAKENPDMITGWEFKQGTINAKSVINMLEKMAGGGNKAFTEAKQIGLIEYLVSRQMGMPHDLAMKYNTSMPESWHFHGKNPAEVLESIRSKYNQKGQGEVSVRDLIDFVETNEFKVRVDELPRANVDSESYVAGGTTSGYRDIVIRMPVDYSHGVEGHFGEGASNVVAHIRVTFRTDGDGRKVMHIEEVQANNANQGVLTEKQKVEAQKKLDRIIAFQKEYQRIVDGYANMEKNVMTVEDDGVSLKTEKRMRREKDDIIRKRDQELKQLNDTMADLVEDGSRFGFSYSKRLASELATSIQKKGNNAPAQEFKDWTKMAFKALMREAVINGAERVTLTPYHKTPVQVGMKPKQAKSLYETILPNAWSSMLKEINAELKADKKFTGEKTAELIKEEGIKLGEVTSNRIHELSQGWSNRVNSQAETDVGYLFSNFHKDPKAIIDDVAPQTITGSRDTTAILKWQTDMEHRIGSIKNQKNRQLAENVYLAKQEEIQHAWNSETNALKELKYKGRKMGESQVLLDESLGFDMTPEAIEYGSRSHPNFKPTEGDEQPRTYSKSSLRWQKGFIGKFAEENPDITKEIKLSFQSERYSKSANQFSNAMNPKSDSSRFFGGKITQQHYLVLTEAGKEVGYITWKTSVKDGKKYFLDPSVRVNEEFRGKKYQHLLYSEAAERARAMGAKQFLQRIENEEGLPLKSQIKTFGEESTKLLSPLRGEWLQPTMDNFYELKNPPYSMEMTDEQGNVTDVQKGRGKEAFVFSWSSMHKPRYKPTENWSNEKTATGSVFKTISGYVITQMGNKFKVYSTDKALLGIYNDLDQAKRRVDREKDKQ